MVVIAALGVNEIALVERLGSLVKLAETEISGTEEAIYIPLRVGVHMLRT